MAIQPDQVAPITTDILLPGIKPKRAPRPETYRLFRGNPVRIALTLTESFLTNKGFNLCPGGSLEETDIQAKVFRDPEDADTEISHKTVENQGIIPVALAQGKFEIQMTKEDLERDESVYVAIYLEGFMVDIFCNPVKPSPEPE